MRKLIYEDLAGNKLFENNTKKSLDHYAKNAKGELMSKHGLNSMLKEANIKKVKGTFEIYRGNK